METVILEYSEFQFEDDGSEKIVLHDAFTNEVCGSVRKINGIYFVRVDDMPWEFYGEEVPGSDFNFDLLPEDEIEF